MTERDKKVYFPDKQVVGMMVFIRCPGEFGLLCSTLVKTHIQLIDSSYFILLPQGLCFKLHFPASAECPSFEGDDTERKLKCSHQNEDSFFSDAVLWVFGASSKYLMTAIFIFFHLLDRSLVLVDLMLENTRKYTRHNVKSQVSCPHLVFKTSTDIQPGGR